MRQQNIRPLGHCGILIMQSESVSMIVGNRREGQFPGLVWTLLDDLWTSGALYNSAEEDQSEWA
jgi:hypothetical protein